MLWLRLIAALVVVFANYALQADECVGVRGFAGHRDVESRCFEMSFDGRQRSYRLYVPERLTAPAPVVFALHGGGGSGGGQEIITHRGFNRIADRDGVIVIYPDGIERNWNDGRTGVGSPAFAQDVDDVGFLKAILQAVSEQLPVDRKRVFATGISNGGFMSYRLACEAATTFLAVAPVAAGLSVDLGPRCQPDRPVSVAIFNGTADPLVPWDGGYIRVMRSKRGETWSAERTYETWIKLDGCRNRRDEPEVNAIRDDGTSLVLHRADDCAAGAQVRLYEIRGGGHNWPRGAKYLSSALVGRISEELDANEVIWSFFKRIPSQ